MSIEENKALPVHRLYEEAINRRDAAAAAGTVNTTAN